MVGRRSTLQVVYSGLHTVFLKWALLLSKFMTPCWISHLRWAHFESHRLALWISETPSIDRTHMAVSSTIADFFYMFLARKLTPLSSYPDPACHGLRLSISWFVIMLLPRPGGVPCTPPFRFRQLPCLTFNIDFHSILLLLLPEITAQWKPTIIQCYQWLIYQAAGSMVLLWLVQVILIMRGELLVYRDQSQSHGMRFWIVWLVDWDLFPFPFPFQVYALYQQNKYLLTAMWILFAMDCIFSTIIASLSVKEVALDVGCNLLQKGVRFYAGW